MKEWRRKPPHAGVVQQVEQLICNQYVVGSTPTTGLHYSFHIIYSPLHTGGESRRIAEWSRGSSLGS